ncbi:MAG: hypothetical protein ACRC32_25285 [Chroococcidiopsis sp.]
METLTTSLLANAKASSLTQPFLLDFITRIKQAYETEPPGRVFSTIVKRDLPNNWIILQFNIHHTRKVDEVGIRWSGNELTVDFLPGGAIAIPICFIDDYGLRWVQMNYSKACPVLKPQDKADIERILTNIYQITQFYKPQLRFILGHSSKVQVKEKTS